jgi:hypothetical protein
MAWGRDRATLRLSTALCRAALPWPSAAARCSLRTRANLRLWASHAPSRSQALGGPWRRRAWSSVPASCAAPGGAHLGHPPQPPGQSLTGSARAAGLEKPAGGEAASAAGSASARAQKRASPCAMGARRQAHTRLAVSHRRGGTGHGCREAPRGWVPGPAPPRLPAERRLVPFRMRARHRSCHAAGPLS